MTETYFADVIVPVPVEGVFSYRVPEKLNEQIAVGKRVLVQFGRRKLYAGIIAGIHQNPPKDYQAKYVEEVLDDYPVVTPSQLQLWKWISEYYMTPVGQVMNVALPLGLKISSETKYVLNPYQNIDENVLSDEEFLVVEALHHQPELSPAEISQITGKNNVMTLVNKLLKDRVIIAKEEVKTLFKPKLETFVKFSPAISDEQTFNTAFEQIGRAAAQQRGILTLAFLTKNDFTKAIPKKEWMEKAKISSSVVNELIKKGYIELYEEEVSRLSFGHDQQPVNPLDKYQSEKLTEIKTQFEKQKVVLLHGVTSSGKTEIYIHLILEELKKGKQVLYLLPEIALTTQIIERLKNIFGEQLGVYHSKFSVHERVEVWQGVLQRKLNLIIGARSSVFLPFQDLGLIIVDEEHDGSFKQMEPSPRYNARDTAVVLAGYFRANVLLGTATPSVESYFNAEKGKYALVEMKKRYGNIQLPEILVADLKNDYKKRKTKGHFSELLYEKIKEALHNNEQVILFQNRRGFSPYIQCNTCDWIATCKNCAVNLTYHKRFHELKCHYCGYTTEMPEKCGKCGSTDIQLRGLGTEKVEEEISEIFPNASVKRMDADTTRSKNAYLSIIKDFENRKIDILIGTQMITKGLDFDNVSVVGIMNADNLLNFPDFRAYERAYQMFTQVAGRAGRKQKRGVVIIQTFTPYHPVIRDVMDNNFLNFYRNEILDRRNYHYPPFYRLVKLIFRHRDSATVAKAARELASCLKKTLKVEIAGPEKPFISWIRNKHLQEIIIKIKPDKYLPVQKRYIHKEAAQLKSRYKGLEIIADVDPY